jgi:hypothetical protein
MNYSRFGIFCSAATFALLNQKVTSVERITINSEYRAGIRRI